MKAFNLKLLHSIKPFVPALIIVTVFIILSTFNLAHAADPFKQANEKLKALVPFLRIVAATLFIIAISIVAYKIKYQGATFKDVLPIVIGALLILVAPDLSAFLF